MTFFENQIRLHGMNIPNDDASATTKPTPEPANQEKSPEEQIQTKTEIPSGNSPSSWQSQSGVEKFKVILQATGVIALLFSAVGLWRDFQGRQEDRINRAWGMVKDRVGMKTALEFLNQHSQDLSGLNLTNLELRGIKLKGAKLFGTDLSGANLDDADFSEARLDSAKFVAANLGGAILTGANLSNADLQRAFMETVEMKRAELQHTKFNRAWMEGVDLADAHLFGSDFSSASVVFHN